MRLGIRDLFKKRSQDEVFGTKILVAALNREFAELASADARCYSQFYSTLAETIFENSEDLLKTIGTGYDVVHLLCDVTPDGNIIDSRGSKTPATLLIRACSNSDVKLLWIASENKPEGYIKGFKPSGKPLNLVLTIDRKNSRFRGFLENLLRKVSAGEAMPVAWVSLAPQNERFSQPRRTGLHIRCWPWRREASLDRVLNAPQDGSQNQKNQIQRLSAAPCDVEAVKTCSDSSLRRKPSSATRQSRQ